MGGEVARLYQLTYAFPYYIACIPEGGSSRCSGNVFVNYM